MPDEPQNPKRRTFLQGSLAAFAFIGDPGQDDGAPFRPTDTALEPVAPLQDGVTRTWIGPSYWSNRLEDWRLNDGRIECLTGRAGDEVRTVALLTRSVERAPRTTAVLSVRTGTLEAGSRGFSGFLVGVGRGELDYRAAALAQKASGAGGGILCAFERDGSIRFRDHRGEAAPLAFAELPSRRSGTGSARTTGEDVTLRLEIAPQTTGRVELKLSAWSGNRFLGGAALGDLPEKEILGGISFVSSGGDGARHWFRDLEAGGDLAAHPERALGPILGCLYSTGPGRALHLNAQFVPVGDHEPRRARLDHRPTATEQWTPGPVVEIGAGYTALFRVTPWDTTGEREFRVVYPADAARPSTFDGVIRKEPVGDLTIAMFSCVAATARTLEGGLGRPELPMARMLGRYTPDTFYFPHRELVASASAHRPDLVVFFGDQIYEGNPTRKDMGRAPVLDYLYKWYLWMLSFRDLTRRTPAVVLIDDHDVYHGNIWGNGGRGAPEGDQNRGGYRCTPAFVNLVQRTQAGHNPTPFEPEPVDQGIGVYYTAFGYGGVLFAVIEDRKWKTAPLQGNDLDVHEAELLGERQEGYLESWARAAVNARLPAICLTQTLFGCLQTSPTGRPLVDFDSNGYPKPGRDRAIKLLREARAVVLSGDQHLAAVVRHGVDSFTDGVVQFSGPQGGTSWTRWFEPAEKLPNSGATPNTGDFIDGFGNKMRVLAVANPKISFAEYRKHIKGRGQGIGDRNLKSDGYGIVRVDKRARTFVLECWPWNAGPGGAQYSGWPVTISFDEA